MIAIETNPNVFKLSPPLSGHAEVQLVFQQVFGRVEAAAFPAGDDSMANMLARAEESDAASFLANLGYSIQKEIKLEGLERLLPFQREPATALMDNIRARRSCLLQGIVGSGKTYVGLESILPLVKSGEIAEPDIFEPEKVLFLMPSPCKIKFRRVANKLGMRNYQIQSFKELITSMGEQYVTWELDKETGDKKPKWIESNFPEVLFIDECQFVKNESAQITQTILAYVRAVRNGAKGCIVFCSGTPFSKLIETKALTMACFNVSDGTWKNKINNIVGGYVDIYRPSETGTERYREALTEAGRFIEIKDVKFSHRAFTKNHFVELDPARRAVYDAAFEELQKRRLEQDRNPLIGFAAILVALNEFRHVSERLRAKEICDLAIERFNKGKQIIVASNFVDTLEAVHARLTAAGFNMSRVGYLTGLQDQTTKQANIDGFQTGKIDIILMTLKTGGTGLSLDHDGSHPDQKPREVILPPTWSPIELTQALGRAHRVLTKSTTRQWIVWCKDTIEDKVAAKVEQGMKSLKKLITRKVSWMSCYEPEERELTELDKLLFDETVETEEGEEEVFDNEVFDDMTEEAFAK